MSKKIVLALGLCVVSISLGVLAGHYLQISNFLRSGAKFAIPTIPKKELPLTKYSIANLTQYPYQASGISIQKIINDFPDYTSYQFTYTTLQKTMSGQLNIPKRKNSIGQFPAIILIRGFVPLEIYQTGVGTRSAAEVFAKHGYVTLAPDFFGYGQSASESADLWEARFQKPISVIELIKTVRTNPQLQANVSIDPQRIGIWAHSNGGQIALTTLEITQQPIPTTLWNPVTAPFPYSVLYFSDEDPDEGKAQRLTVAKFEKEYDPFDFSLTQHLDLLRGPLQLHQGLADESIHFTWSQKFADKIKTENKKRQVATDSAAPINLTFYTYPGTDHNMRPSWNEAIQHDLDFFAKTLK